MDFLLFLSVFIVGFVVCSLFYGASKSVLLGKDHHDDASNDSMHSAMPRINKSRNIYSLK